MITDHDHGDEDDGAGGCTGMRAVLDVLARAYPLPREFTTFEAAADIRRRMQLPPAPAR